MSPYHFLRTFRAVVGMTPHQFILRTRLNRAAVRLRRTDEHISAIAFAAGFNDLSTFNRRFQRMMGSARAPIARRTRLSHRAAAAPGDGGKGARAVRSAGLIGGAERALERGEAIRIERRDVFAHRPFAGCERRPEIVEGGIVHADRQHRIRADR